MLILSSQMYVALVWFGGILPFLEGFRRFRYTGGCLLLRAVKFADEDETKHGNLDKEQHIIKGHVREKKQAESLCSVDVTQNVQYTSLVHFATTNTQHLCTKLISTFMLHHNMRKETEVGGVLSFKHQPTFSNTPFATSHITICQSGPSRPAGLQ